MKLLIVDDEFIVTDTLVSEYNWKAMGVSEVYAAYNGEDAWNILKNDEIDIMLCDIEMPFMNGIALQKKIVENVLKTVTIFLTCRSDFSYAQQALRIGVYDYILKPASQEEIASTIKRLVKKLNHDSTDNSIPQAESEAVRKACLYIEENLYDDIQRNDIAAHVFLNPDYLNRLFNKELGKSITQYIIEQKMKKARRLLTNTDLSITEVCSQVGYPNMSSFSYAFRRHTGYTPTAYRKKTNKSK